MPLTESSPTYSVLIIDDEPFILDIIVNRATLVTIQHVADTMRLTMDAWRPIAISWSVAEYGAPKFSLETRARLIDAGSDGEEKPVRIMLEDELPLRLAPARIREEPLKDGDPVVAIGYTHGVLRFATGSLNFPEPNPDAEREAEPSPYLPFELADEKRTDRLAIDHGASGGPIADCDGRVAAVFVDVITQDEKRSEALSGMIGLLEALEKSGASVSEELQSLRRLSTSWGQFNAYGAVPTFSSR